MCAPRNIVSLSDLKLNSSTIVLDFDDDAAGRVSLSVNVLGKPANPETYDIVFLIDLKCKVFAKCFWHKSSKCAESNSHKEFSPG
jgi:hypothetical protein